MQNLSFLKVLIGTLLVPTVCFQVQARPCKLTDPDGNNPDNLCPKYTFTPGIHTNSFQPGDGQPVRGLSTASSPLPPVLIDPGQEFWTEIRTQGTTRQLKTSGGKSYKISK